MTIQPKGKQVEVLGIGDSGHFVVLGTAGSGKTTIALLRAINLANLPGNDKVLLVTFNRALVEYMKGIENISGRLIVENYHKFAKGYLKSRGKMPTFGGIAENGQREMLIDSAVEVLKKEHPVESTYKRKQAFFYDEIKFIEEFGCNGVQREHNKKLNNGLPILHKVPPKRDYGRYFCIMAEKGGTSHGGLTEKLSLFFHAKKQEVNAYGR